MVMTSLNPRKEYIDLALASAKGFSLKLLHIDNASALPVYVPDAVVYGFQGISIHKHLSPAVALNTLIEALPDGFISVFCDDDEYLSENLLVLQEGIHEGKYDNADIVHFQCQINHAHNWGEAEFTLQQLIEHDRLPCSSFFHKRVWEGVGGFSDVPASDWNFWLKAKHMGFSFRYFPLPVYRYNMDIQDSLLKRDCKKYGYVSFKVMEDYREWVRRNEG